MEIFVSILLLIFAALLLFFAVSNLISILSGAPAVSSNRTLSKEILKLSELKKGEKFYELGSGFGFISRYMADHGARATGIEISPFYTWCSRVFFWQRDDIQIKQDNIYRSNLSQADIIYCYLFPKVMSKLESKFEQELKPGTRVISQSFKLPNKKPSRTINTPLGSKIYLYKY
ncbi:hypothetical protein KC644_03580 [Candidatus Berkelbacteria bacterium]|nr:hypothetical protein [Candidatus Berkelbacteria bacterium]